MSGVVGVSFLLMNDMIGGGMMTLSDAVKDCGGIVLFIIIHIIIILISTSTLLIVGYCSGINQTSTYQETVLKICGKTFYRISTILIILYSFGSCVLCLLVIEDQWEEFFLFTIRHQYCDIRPLYLNKKVVMSITSCIFVLPFCFCKKADFLVYPSIFGVVGVTYITFLLPVKYHTQNTILQKDVLRSPKAKWTDIFIAIPAIIFTYQIHMCAIPMYSSMKQASFKKFTCSVAITILTGAILYSIIAIYGYLSFGDQVTTDILLSYEPTTDVSVAVMMIAIKIYTHYPIKLFVGRQAIESMWMDVNNMSDKDLAKNEKTRRIIVSLIWFLGSIFIAVFVPNIGIIVRYLGIIAFSFILIFPGLCLLNLKPVPSFVGNGIIIVVACGIIALGVLITVTAILQSVLKDSNAKTICADVSKYTC